MDTAQAARPQRVHDYHTPVSDTDRWAGFTHRPGDILVCTPPKCGTTWTQMICALLAHQTPELPQPLTRLSRWIERVTQPIEEVEAELGAQAHRRVLKTHTPLDGLPYFDDVAYVVCGRDLRDAFLSMCDHLTNASEATVADAKRRLGLPDDAPSPFPEEPNALYPIWMTVPDQAWTEDGAPMGSATHFFRTFWAHRHAPNIFFTHYADLTRDLDGEMRRLAAFLGTPIDAAIWPSLVDAASFASMRSRAADAAPGAHLGEWRSNEDFFRKGRMGEWRTALSPQNQSLYAELTPQRLAPELQRWLEGGRTAVDPKAS